MRVEVLLNGKAMPKKDLGFMSTSETELALGNLLKEITIAVSQAEDSVVKEGKCCMSHAQGDVLQ